MATTRFHRATGSTAIASTLAPGVAWQLEEIRIHLSAAGGAGDFTATLDHGTGTAYNCVMYTKDMTSITNHVYHFQRPEEFDAATEMDFAWANSNSRTYGLEVVWKAI
jgi:hypothetical protein